MNIFLKYVFESFFFLQDGCGKRLLYNGHLEAAALVNTDNFSCYQMFPSSTSKSVVGFYPVLQNKLQTELHLIYSAEKF